MVTPRPSPPTGDGASGSLPRRLESVRPLVDQLPLILFELDLEGNLTFVNEFALESTGYDKRDLETGMNVRDFVVPADRDRIRENISKKLHGEDFEDHEYRLLKKDGTSIPVIISSTPIVEEGEPVGLVGTAQDISANRKVQGALNESEERYRDLVEKAGVGIVVDDREGRFLFVNDKFRELSGYGEEDLPFLSIRKFVHPQDQAKVMTHHKERIAGGHPSSRYRFRALRKDGSPLHLEIDSAPLVKEGEVVGTHWYMWDITESVRMEEMLGKNQEDLEGKIRVRTAELLEANTRLREEIEDRRRAEEALEKSEKYYRSLFDSAQVGITMGPNDGKITAVNEEFTRIFGYSAAEAVGRSIDELIAFEADRTLAQEATKRVARGERVTFEAVRRRKDGNPVHVSVIASPVTHEGVQVGVHAIYRDITARKEAEAALKLEEAHLEQLFEGVQVGIVMADVKGKGGRVKEA
ncbi:MAG: PAS domain-containing protein [Planctomycetota bacterium]|jgi:PAS domain S-box-containing protein